MTEKGNTNKKESEIVDSIIDQSKWAGACEDIYIYLLFLQVDRLD